MKPKVPGKAAKFSVTCVTQPRILTGEMEVGGEGSTNNGGGGETTTLRFFSDIFQYVLFFSVLLKYMANLSSVVSLSV